MAAININIEKANFIIPAIRRGFGSAINKAVRLAVTAASKKVREVYNIKAKDLKDRTRINKANANRASGSFTVQSSRFKLLLFSARETATGVSVLIRKDHGRRVVTSGFIEKMPSGHINVFKRVGKSRLPIESLTTVDAATMYGKEAEKTVAETLEKNFFRLFEKEIDFRLSKI